jgi:hypothetical protein
VNEAARKCQYQLRAEIEADFIARANKLHRTKQDQEKSVTVLQTRNDELFLREETLTAREKTVNEHLDSLLLRLCKNIGS